ncbi:ABC transporter ATP-binding protein [Promineifilum sp.]|uniref:ABC transporter ATP-binding protein n=1 Tax=Promineifilum sp. TaxID=2664178 RepID=UPI0035AE1806
MTLLEVVGVSKSFAPGTSAVDAVSLTLERGEVLCLLGPSGCGKTTLLRIISGLERADAGQVRFDGRDMAGVPPHERSFGMMFQDFALFPHKNVRDNVAFGLRMRRLPAAEIDARVAEMLAAVDLDGFGGREIGQLSGGEQQRVALARALAPGPQLLMLDEPLGALDRALRERLMLDVRVILKRVGMTAIYVTHDQAEAFAVSDRMAVMNAGRIEQLDRPEAVHAQPATPFVARFLGFENLLPARVAAAGEVETAVGRFRPAGEPLPFGATGLLLIKPVLAGIEAAGAADKGAINQVAGVVEAVTFRGRFSQLWLAAGGERLLFEEQDSLPFAPGDRVRVTVGAEQLQMFVDGS